MGFGNEAEGTQVPHADPCQYDVAQLPTGRFHYWGVPEPEHIQKNKYAQKRQSGDAEKHYLYNHLNTAKQHSKKMVRQERAKL